MDRRRFIALGSLPALGVAGRAALASGSGAGLGAFEEARHRFLALPGDKSFAIAVDGGGRVAWRSSHRPKSRVFVGSAIKTFILATYLRQVEANVLSETELLPIDDRVRSLVSPVFGSDPKSSENLTGKTLARNVLEAMIAHSDNTATDAALSRVGVEKVRAFIASAGLTATLIPQSTRVMISYFAGAPLGVDKGWAGMEAVAEDKFFGKPRSPINDKETMASTAAEMVSYYRRALAGKFFTRPATLIEFKRIQAMADAIPRIVPPDIAAYAKGGSIDWQDFHALSVPGQMIVAKKPVTFSFTVNWHGPAGSVPEISGKYVKSVADMLAAVAHRFG